MCTVIFTNNTDYINSIIVSILFIDIVDAEITIILRIISVINIHFWYPGHLALEEGRQWFSIGDSMRYANQGFRGLNSDES